jgi:hypothetical protein
VFFRKNLRVTYEITMFFAIQIYHVGAIAAAC